MGEKNELSEYETLLRQYLDVCNAVISTNRDQALLNQLWQTLEDYINDERMVISLLDDREKGRHLLQFKDRQIHCKDDMPPEEASVWHLRYSHLQYVVDHANEYKDNPAKLDLSWLKRARDAG